MRVLQLGPFPPPYGGVQTNLVDIRSYLRKQGIPCAVINVTRHRRSNADEVYYPSSARELLGLLAKLRYDIVHQHFGGMLTNRILALSIACTFRPGTKAVMTFHSGGFPSTPEGQALGPNSLAGFVMRRFDGVIAVNAEIVSFFKKLRVSPQRVRLISPYSAVNPEDLGALPERLETFFAEHDPVLISAGQLEPEYDLPLQIAAMPQLRQNFPKIGLALLGSGSIEQDLRSQIQSTGCAEHILLAGDVAHDAAMQAFSQSRILLRTTLYDGDAISVREALQMGTSVIASDNAMRPPGVKLVPKSDLPALVRAIAEELREPATPKEKAPTDESNLQAVLDFYRELLGEKK